MKIVVWLFIVTAFFSCQLQTDTIEVDVLVIGGTTSGISAGIQASRLGAKTLVVEETPWLGGMLTSSGVSAVDGNHHMPSGIWNEFRELLRYRYGGADALSTGWVSNTLFEPHIGDSIFKAMAAKEELLKVIYEYYPVSVQKKGIRVTGATFQNMQGEILRVKARITIDATDLGDGLAMAGATYRLGMDAKIETGEDIAPSENNDIVQDITWVAILKDYGNGDHVTLTKPAEYDPDLYRECCNLIEDGNNVNCDMMLNYGRLPNKKYMINWPRNGNDIYLNVVEMSREQRIVELQKAKNRTLGFVYYIQHELGYKHLGLADDEFDTPDQLAYTPYHREGRRMDGLVRFTYNHVMNPYGRPDPLYRTGISVGDYPVDHHHKCNPAAPELAFLPVPSFCIPVGALIPEKIDGLIVSDKAISVTNLINGSTRLQPVVLLTGQAAGVLAALCIAEEKQPRDVSVRKIQQNLLGAQAYIMPLYDVKPDDQHFQAIQRIAATGILKTEGQPYHWANRTWFYPDTTITTGELCGGLNSFYKSNIIPQDDSLTLDICLGLLSTIKGQKINTDIIEHWNEISCRPFQSDMPLLKRELAVIIDRHLDPFSLKINHHGQPTE